VVRPGDLLFYFRNGAHHVAIYVGHGLMVSADHSSVGVRLEPFLFSWFGAHFTGVGRVLN
jgi:cell wall-associated NlpC family hydrolase